MKGNVYVLVYGSMITGGIQTLIARLANYMVEDGRRVLVCSQPGEVLSVVTPSAARIIYNTPSELTESFHAWLGEGRSSSLAFISFDAFSSGLALQLETSCPESIATSHVAGVFHPRAYFQKDFRRDVMWLNRQIASAVGLRRVFFMNEECRSAHASFWGADLSCCPIIHLPIGEMNGRWRPRGGPAIRGVSVGRLVDFKLYNAGLPSVVADLIARGVECRWDVYGTGPLEPEIRQRAREGNVEERIRLMGHLPYPEFGATVSQYDVFVGHGTSALEAALTGIPTICATVDETRLSYGYLHELPKGNVGERLPTPPDKDIADLVERYSNLSKTSRGRLGELSRDAVSGYRIGSFVESLDAIFANEHAQSPRSRSKKRIVAAMHCLLTNSFAGRSVRASRRMLEKLKSS